MELETAPPVAPVPSAEKAPSTEEEAWALVLARWGDEEAHRAYLARFADLEGLGRAGQRYREVLASRPEDPVAARWRDEIVKRALVEGLAQLPRTPPPRAVSPGARRLLVAGLAVVATVAVGWLALSLARLGGRP
jgi:hypothetical protein